MTKHEKVANIVAFFAIMFGEDNAIWNEIWNQIMKIDPNYIIEKFQRYVLSERVEYPWGMHPSLRKQRFDAYTKKWGLELKEDE